MDTIYYNGHEYHKTYDHEAGGTPHTSEEIERVKKMIEELE